MSPLSMPSVTSRTPLGASEPIAPAYAPQPPTQGAMEAFISSRINAAGGRVMKPGGKAGFLYQSGPFKGMTLEQATEAARTEWTTMAPTARETWASTNLGNTRTQAETGSSPSTSAAPFGLNAPKFNAGQKVGPDGKKWGLGDMPAPTSSVERGGNSAPATAAEQAMLPKPTFAVTNKATGGPPAPGQVAKTIDGQYGTGSVTTGMPAPTARTGRIFDNGKDVTGQVMDSLAARQPSAPVAPSGPSVAALRSPKYPTAYDQAMNTAGDVVTETAVKAATPLATPKPIAALPNPMTHSPVSPFGPTGATGPVLKPKNRLTASR